MAEEFDNHSDEEDCKISNEERYYMFTYFKKNEEALN
jgi:hypothetical protein